MYSGNCVRSVARVADLAGQVSAQKLAAETGIAHTRWATHGAPSEANAHPHISGGLAVVHNGIIENHEAIRARLKAEGYRFTSETDTEVIAHLIEHYRKGASDLLAAAVRRLESEGRTSLGDYAASRPGAAETAATQQAASLCESTGAPIYIVHLSSARALAICRAARAAARLPLFVETRPMYLHLTSEKMRGPDAPLYVGQPPLREETDRAALWQGMHDAAIDVLATDHAPWTRAQKLDPALTISRLRPGVSDLQFMLPMYFSEGVQGRRLPLPRFVAQTSTNAARIFGLYPRKGVIQAGADADIGDQPADAVVGRKAPIFGSTETPLGGGSLSLSPSE